MAENSAIEWCDHTFNPWEGCQKVGPGCDHCYAEARNARFGGGIAPNWGLGAPRRRTSEANWRKPLAWNAAAARAGTRPRVFCASLADVFDTAVPPDWRSDLFELIRSTPQLDWLLLTKRIGNVARMLADDVETDQMPDNVWLGATIVNQEEADRDVPKLLAVRARVRFLSMEPLLGPVDLTCIDLDGDSEMDALNIRLWEAEVDDWRDSSDTWEADFEDWYSRSVTASGPMHPTLDWIIVGGESGPSARPMHPDWARSLRRQCAAAEVPFLFKQWGEWGSLFELQKTYFEFPPFVSLGDWHDDQFHHHSDGWPCGYGGYDMARVGKKRAGRLLDGVQHDGFPA